MNILTAAIMSLLAVLNPQQAQPRITELPVVRVLAPISETRTGQFTGTHIGDGWILTCGHCCDEKAKNVEVKILCSHSQMPARSVKGTVVCYDPVAEVGLIRMANGHGLKPRYRLAPRNTQVSPGEEVIMFDWHEEGSQVQLRAERQRITGINKYVGPASIETTGSPREGVSGAPLILSRTGLIVGVTTGVNVTHQRGMHTGLEPIHRLFDQYRASKTQDRVTARQASQSSRTTR